MPDITFIAADGTEHGFEAPAGVSLMQAATGFGVPGILADCGGSASCGTCHVVVGAAWADRLPAPDSHPLVWRALMAQSVVDIMATPVPGVATDTDIRRVARVLLDTGLPGLPVVDDAGHVIGFVSRSDILRAVVADPPLDLWT